MSDHEDVDGHLKFLDHGYCDLFTPFDHDGDSFIVDTSNPLCFDDIPNDEVETPQVVEAPQFQMMVMSGPPSLEASSTSNKKYIKTPQAPHYPPSCIEDTLSYRFHILHLNHTILSLMHWRNHTQ